MKYRGTHPPSQLTPWPTVMSKRLTPHHNIIFTFLKFHKRYFGALRVTPQEIMGWGQKEQACSAEPKVKLA